MKSQIYSFDREYHSVPVIHFPQANIKQQNCVLC